MQLRKRPGRKAGRKKRHQQAQSSRAGKNASPALPPRSFIPAPDAHFSDRVAERKRSLEHADHGSRGRLLSPVRKLVAALQQHPVQSAFRHRPDFVRRPGRLHRGDQALLLFFQMSNQSGSSPGTSVPMFSSILLKMGWQSSITRYPLPEIAIST